MHYAVWETGSDIPEISLRFSFIPQGSEGMNSALCLHVEASVVAECLLLSLLLVISVVFSPPGISQRIIGKY